MIHGALLTQVESEFRTPNSSAGYSPPGQHFCTC